MLVQAEESWWNTAKHITVRTLLDAADQPEGVEQHSAGSVEGDAHQAKQPEGLLVQGQVLALAEDLLVHAQ